MSAAAGSPAMGTSSTSAYDVVVAGGGPGGYVAAIRAAQLGLKVAVIERDELGGICLNWGCIPSKTLLRNAEIISLIKRAGDFGVTVGEVSVDYSAGIRRCRKVIATQVRGVSYLMRKNNIDVIRGSATLLATDRIGVSGGSAGDREVYTKHIIIATGSRVRPLSGVTVDGEHIVSSKEIWALDTLPQSVLVIGSGPIGVEFATVFSAYGSSVTLVEFLPRLLPGEDAEISAELAKSFAKRGMKVLTSTAVVSAAVVDGKVEVKLAPAPGATGTEQTVTVDRVLLAAGFTPNSDNLGLDTVGVAINEQGYIETDDYMRTSAPSIFAVGDVTGKLPLAHVAFAQGEVAAETIVSHPTVKLDYHSMPRCTYSQPQVASIGLTEAQAKEKGYEVATGIYPFRPNGKAQALNELEGQVKIIADAQTGELLGAQMIGPEVTELIGELSIARMLESTPFELGRSVHPHPTLSEVVGEAALATEGHAIHL
ncbi:MAG: dihydrolipoyl dehydrogenase [Chloroflexi bacterium]|nr:dihydrolipoyl dehydrogenase [Chloroflexota bacterium]